MRIRSILPKFYESEDVGQMDWHTRLLFIGLWSYVDDNGVGRDVDALIVADLFPFDLSRDPRETLARVADGLQHLAAGGQIVRYTIDNKPLLYIAKWDEYQRIDRPNKPRYDRPTSTNAEIRETLATPSRHPRDTPATGEGEKGRRGEGEKGLSCASADADDATDDRFDEFWDVYDRRIGKKAARQKWASALRKRGVTPDLLIDAASRYIDHQRQIGKHPEFTKHPSVWLNGEHWNDDLTAAKPAMTEAERAWREPPPPPAWLYDDPEPPQ